MQIPEAPALRFWFYRPDMCPRDRVVFLFCFLIFLTFFWWLARFENHWIKPHIITVIFKVWYRQFSMHASWHLEKKSLRNLYQCIYRIIIIIIIWNIDSQKAVKMVSRIPGTAHPESPNSNIWYRYNTVSKPGNWYCYITVNQPLFSFHHFLTCIHLCAFFATLFHVQIHVATTTAKM